LSQKVNRFLASLLLFVILSGAGLAIGIYIGKGLMYLNEEGYWSSWKKLNSRLKFEKIVEANSRNIWAEVSDGKIYHFSFNCYENSTCNQWIETQRVPDGIHSGPELPITKDASCYSANKLEYFENPPGILVECVSAFSLGADIMPGRTVHYALVAGGDIWAWSHSGSMLELLIFSVLCPSFGLFLGIIGSVTLIHVRTSQIAAG
jgi:hypothetical protein